MMSAARSAAQIFDKLVYPRNFFVCLQVDYAKLRQQLNLATQESITQCVFRGVFAVQQTVFCRDIQHWCITMGKSDINIGRGCPTSKTQTKKHCVIDFNIFNWIYSLE
jgi:hypothetical protein